MKMIAKYTAGLLLIVCSAASHAAMTVWVVESGQGPLSNSQGVLEVTAGTTSLDLYYGLSGGEISYGYDFILDITGSGSISNVSGGDSDPLAGGVFGSGWRQFGGDFLGETGSAVLGFSFDFTATAGAALLINGGSSYTNSSFLDEGILPATLANVSGEELATVPVPAAVWLFGSGCVGLIGFARRKKS
jgi:hypothetical protein